MSNFLTIGRAQSALGPDLFKDIGGIEEIRKGLAAYRPVELSAFKPPDFQKELEAIKASSFKVDSALEALLPPKKKD